MNRRKKCVDWLTSVIRFSKFADRFTVPSGCLNGVQLCDVIVSVGSGRDLRFFDQVKAVSTFKCSRA